MKTQLPARQLISLIFPASCLGCDTELLTQTPHSATAPSPKLNFLSWQDEHWCRDCWSKIASRPQVACQKCGAYLTIENPLGDRCHLCHGHDLRFDTAIAVGNYQTLLQDLIIKTKGNHDESLAVQLGNLLGYELLAAGWNHFDHVIPVPAHWWRRLKRGFLASYILCESISHILSIPKSESTVIATRQTQKQGTLSTPGRFANVKGAFSVVPRAKIENNSFLIVDDVMTSGATASEIARVLKRAGAAEVAVAVVARGARVS